MPYTCLIIDDSESVRNLVGRILAEERIFDSCLQASDGIEGFKLLLKHQPDLVLCDVVMPGIDGFTFLRLKNGKPEFNRTPVIMLTGQEDVSKKVQGLEAGASDYLTKPFEPKELIARVRVHLKIKQLQDELERKNLELEWLSQTDGLTRINNRRHFMELVELEFARAERYKSPLTYLMLDIDHFKKINDTHGHQAGDHILVEMAKCLSTSLRNIDIVGRYGGEEFGLFLPETNEDGGRIVAERDRMRIESMEIFLPDFRKPVRITVSIGGVTYPRPDIKGPDDLIRLADLALYESKQNGRNRVTWAAHRKLEIVRSE